MSFLPDSHQSKTNIKCAFVKCVWSSPTLSAYPGRAYCHEDRAYLFSLGTEANRNRKAVYVWKHWTHFEPRKKNAVRRQVLSIPSRKILIFPNRKLTHVPFSREVLGANLPRMCRPSMQIISSWKLLKHNKVKKSFLFCFVLFPLYLPKEIQIEKPAWDGNLSLFTLASMN